MAFENAATVAPKKASTGKPKKEVLEVKGLRQYGVCATVIKNLEAVKTTMHNGVKQCVREMFIERCTKAGKVENFTGTEGDAEGSIQLKKRGANSPLTLEEMQHLDNYEVPYGREESVIGTFVINPKYLSDEKVMAKAEKAILKAGLPEDFIQKQEPQVKYVVTDDTVDTVVKKGLVANLIDTCFTISVSSKVPESDTELQKTINSVMEALTPPEEKKAKGRKAKK